MPISKKEKAARLIRLAEAVADRDASGDSHRPRKENNKKEKKKAKTKESDAGPSTQSEATTSTPTQAEASVDTSSKPDGSPEPLPTAGDTPKSDILEQRATRRPSADSFLQPDLPSSPQQSSAVPPLPSVQTPIRPIEALRGFHHADSSNGGAGSISFMEGSPHLEHQIAASTGSSSLGKTAIETRPRPSSHLEDEANSESSGRSSPKFPEASASSKSPANPFNLPEGLLQILRAPFPTLRSSKAAGSPGLTLNAEGTPEPSSTRSVWKPGSFPKRSSKREAVSNFASNFASGLRRTSKPPPGSNPTAEPFSPLSMSGNPTSSPYRTWDISDGARPSSSLDLSGGVQRPGPPHNPASQYSSPTKSSTKAPEKRPATMSGQEVTPPSTKWATLPARRLFSSVASGRKPGIALPRPPTGPRSIMCADKGEFPSLSNNPQMSSANQGSMWSNQSNAGSRNISAPVQRNQSTPLSSQQGQDDIYSPPGPRMTSQQGSFRYGAQGNVGSSQQGQSSNADDFPPLNRTGNEDMGLASQVGAGSGTGSMQANRGNGLLNALSATSRASEARSPPGIPTPGASRPQDDGADHTLPAGDATGSSENQGAAPGSADERDTQAPEPVDLLSGMPEADKWGIRGLRTLMNNNPDYHAMVVGLDPNSLGLDLSSPEPITNQVFSIFDDAAPRPTVAGSRPRLPDCYNVTNVQPMETKLQSFNEEALFWIFYSCPQDEQQMQAAQELHTRNWRWHKKHKVWLTKDETLAPAILSPLHERGFYVVWDTAQWRKDRREFTLYYHDLETSIGQGGPGA